MKRLISTLLVTLCVATVAPASASASISVDYCAGPKTYSGSGWKGSLRGDGTLAPDNDLRASWDYWQARGYNITSAYWYGYTYWGSTNDLLTYWYLVRANGDKIRITLRCWREGGRDTGTYHDDQA